MIDFDTALRIITDAATIGPTRSTCISNTVGSVLAEPIRSTVDVSPFRASAMDGFALRAEWLSGCTTESPKSVPITQTIFAGESKSCDIATEHAVKIMTGAPLPDHLDTVVKFEETSYDQQQVTFSTSPKTGANVRLPGEDIKREDSLFEKGHLLTELDLGILASIGLAEAPVISKPRALIAATGNELVAPGLPLGPGQIYNSNEYSIEAMIASHCHKVDRASVADNPESLQTLLSSEHDLIITSGGVSAGEKDLVKQTAESSGWESLFHKVSIKPGKPIYFARKDRQLLIGLPGNPLSTAVTCAVFLLPLLRKMGGHLDYSLRLTEARLTPGQSRAGRRFLIWPGRIWREGERIMAEYSEKKSSAALTALKGSDGLIFQETADQERDNSAVRVIEWSQLLRTSTY